MLTQLDSIVSFLKLKYDRGRKAKTIESYADDYDWAAWHQEDNILFCKFCKVSVSPSRNRLDEHESSKKHKMAIQIANDSKITLYTKNKETLTPVHYFVKSLLKDCVPLNVIDKSIGSFVKQVIPTLPSAKTCSSKIVNELYLEEQKNIETMIECSQIISILIDETPDTFGRPTVGILLNMFNFESWKNELKLITLCRCESPNAEIIEIVTRQACSKWSKEIKDFPIINSDSASYMRKFAKTMIEKSKKEKQSFIFMPCYAHLINVLVNNLMTKVHGDLNNFLISLSSFFKSDKNCTLFAEIALSFGIKMRKPPQIAPHRWFAVHETLEFAKEFYCVFEKLAEKDLKNYGKKAQVIQNSLDVPEKSLKLKFMVIFKAKPYFKFIT